MRVYVSRDPDRRQRWRVEVRGNGWTHVYKGSAPMGRFRSLRDAADFLVGQGITMDDLIED